MLGMRLFSSLLALLVLHLLDLLSHMRCITKEKTALFIPNAIAIITSRKEYIFRSFWDREDAFRTLKNCHQASLRQGSPGSTQNPPSQEVEPSLVR